MNNPDYALDCVHEAFEKAMTYLEKHPNEVISDYLLVREVSAAARRDNKHYSIELGRVIQDNDEPIDTNNAEEY